MCLWHQSTYQCKSLQSQCHWVIMKVLHSDLKLNSTSIGPQIPSSLLKYQNCHLFGFSSQRPKGCILGFTFFPHPISCNQSQNHVSSFLLPVIMVIPMPHHFLFRPLLLFTDCETVPNMSFCIWVCPCLTDS